VVVLQLSQKPIFGTVVGMTLGVTIRAKQITFQSLFALTFQREIASSSEAELFGRRISMMKVQSTKALVVATVNALTARFLD
jgi:hypothetical protein